MPQENSVPELAREAPLTKLNLGGAPPPRVSFRVGEWKEGRQVNMARRASDAEEAIEVRKCPYPVK
jgi:hypothetical protein